MNKESLLMKQAMKQRLTTLARLQSSSLWKEADAILKIPLQPQYYFPLQWKICAPERMNLGKVVTHIIKDCIIMYMNLATRTLLFPNVQGIDFEAH